MLWVSIAHCVSVTTKFNVVCWVVLSFLTESRFFPLFVELLYPVNMALMAVHAKGWIFPENDTQLNFSVNNVAIFSFVIWAVRLSVHLFAKFLVMYRRVDNRFAKLKSKYNLAKFLFYHWLLVVVNGSAIPVFTGNHELPMEFSNLPLFSIFLIVSGLGITAVADSQKLSKIKHQCDKNGKRKFPMTSGLWAISRHPNYFGEILFFFGISLLAVPFLDVYSFLFIFGGSVHLTLAVLLFAGFFRKFSSVKKVIEIMNKDKESLWNSVAYQNYASSVSLLIPGTPADPNSRDFRRAGFGMGMWLVCEGIW
jgi:steroid 5-alpha reductase family enzyme